MFRPCGGGRWDDNPHVSPTPSQPSRHCEGLLLKHTATGHTSSGRISLTLECSRAHALQLDKVHADHHHPSSRLRCMQAPGHAADSSSSAASTPGQPEATKAPQRQPRRVSPAAQEKKVKLEVLRYLAPVRGDALAFGGPARYAYIGRYLGLAPGIPVGGSYSPRAQQRTQHKGVVLGSERRARLKALKCGVALVTGG